VGELFNRAKDKILESKASFLNRGSGWRFVSVEKLDIPFARYVPFRGASYIPLPEKLASKKTIVNMQNRDVECFKWCITRSLNPVDRDSERITTALREQAQQLDWTGIDFPVAADDNTLAKFERHNNVGVNVFGYENQVFPIYLSKQQNAIDLLLISDGNMQHYCWIKNFNKLMSVRTGKSHNAMRYCRRCMLGYREQASLDRHEEYCSKEGALKIELPEPGTMLAFKSYWRSMRVPFIIYADFESFIRPIYTCEPDSSKSNTNKFQKHTPNSFTFQIKCFDNSIYQQDPVIYTAEDDDEDIAQVFIDTLEANIK